MTVLASRSIYRPCGPPCFDRLRRMPVVRHGVEEAPVAGDRHRHARNQESTARTGTGQPSRPTSWRLRAVLLLPAFGQALSHSYGEPSRSRIRSDPIVHLEADLNETVTWAERSQRAFTLANAAASYSEDRCDLALLEKIDAVHARDWRGRKDEKQAEFLTLLPMGACPANRGALAGHAAMRPQSRAGATSPPTC